jgi:dihydroorotase-like cyclic amidohydrolase
VPGAVAISDDGQPVTSSRVMRRAMEFARSYDLPVIDHCEDLLLSAGGDMHEGAQSGRWGLRGIPAAAEDVMVARDLLLAQLTGARCPFGIIGLETAIALALEELVAAGKITLARLVELFTTGPESVLRLGRGTLAPGAPGDVTVFSTDVEWTYDVNQSASRSRNSPFHGRTFHGGPMATVVDGEMKWRR